MINTDKIYINKDEELDAKKLGKIIRKFRYSTLQELEKRRGYYDGSGQAIMNRVMSDPSKPNHKIVKNYCLSAVRNFQAYICGGNNPVTYKASNPDDDIQPLLDVLKDNDVVNSDSEWLKSALVYGMAPQLVYINENNEIKFRNVSAENVIPIFSADLDEELLYVIYFYPVVDWEKDDWDTTYSVNVYDANNIIHYTSSDEFNSFNVDGEPEQHHFGEVPFSIFYLNDDGTSIFDCIIGLQDAYNVLLSDSVNDWASFCDAYLITKNGKIEPEDLADMRQNRVISSDDDMDVYYLTKNTNDTQVVHLMEEINKSIHTIANSPDFSSEEFGSGVSSGIALAYKLVGFNNVSSNIEAQFKKAIYKRLDLINKVFKLISTDTYDINVDFTHNLPTNLSDNAEVVASLRGLVSSETLLTLLPFVSDPAAEAEKVQAEYKGNVNLGEFNMHGGDSNDN